MTTLPQPSTIARRERELLRSILWYPDVKWGPNVSSAIAFMPQLGASGLNRIAEAIIEVIVAGRPPTESSVIERLSALGNAEKVSNLMNGIGQPDPLPLSIQEVEALDMIAWYKGKLLWRLVAQAEATMRTNFYGAVEVARKLGEELGKSL